MQKLCRQNKNIFPATRNNPNASKVQKKSTKVTQAIGNSREGDYVRKFFSRRFKLEMKVRQSIFRQGRSINKLQQSIKHWQSSQVLDVMAYKNEGKKRQLASSISTCKKVPIYNEEQLVSHNKYLNLDENTRIQGRRNEKINGEGEIEINKFHKKMQKWQKDKLILDNIEMAPEIMNKNEIQSKFKNKCIKKDFEKVKQELAKKVIKSQQNFALANKNFEPAQQNLHLQLSPCRFNFCPKFQGGTVRFQISQPGCKQIRINKQSQCHYSNRQNKSLKVTETGEAMRGRSKAFKTQLGHALRNKLANLIVQQKQNQKIRLRKAQNIYPQPLIQINCNQDLFEDSFEKNCSGFGSQGLGFPIQQEKGKQRNRFYKSNLHCQQVNAKLIKESEEIRAEKCQTSLKKTQLSKEMCEQAKSESQQSQILCAICQTNIPHSLWNHAVFYNKNRAEYYQFYELFSQQEQGRNSMMMADENQTIVPLLLHCGHSFHRICLEEWFRYKTVCPLCKTDHDDGKRDLAGELSDDDGYDDHSWSQDSPYYGSIEHEQQSQNFERSQFSYCGTLQHELGVLPYTQSDNQQSPFQLPVELSQADQQNNINSEYSSMDYQESSSQVSECNRMDHVWGMRSEGRDQDEQLEGKDSEEQNEITWCRGRIRDEREYSDNWEQSDSSLIFGNDVD